MSCFLQSFELERVVVRVARSRAPARHFLPRAVSAMEAELTCPITGEIFLRPALLVGDGHTYERAAAERWLARSATSPLPGDPLPPHGLALVDNHALRKQAEAFLERHPDLRPDPESWLSAPGPTSDDAAAPSAPPAPEEEQEEEEEEDDATAAKRRARESIAGRDHRHHAPSAPSLDALSLRDAASSPLDVAVLVGGTRGGLRAFDLARNGARETRWEDSAGLGSARPSSSSSSSSSSDDRPVAFVVASEDARCPTFASARANASVVSLWRPRGADLSRATGSRAEFRTRDWVTCGAMGRDGDWAAFGGRSDAVDVVRLSDPSLLDAEADDADNDDGAEEGRLRVVSRARIAADDGHAPWHKDFVTRMVRSAPSAILYGSEDWTVRAADVGALRGGTVVGRASAPVTALAAAGSGDDESGIIRPRYFVAGSEDGRAFAFDPRAGAEPVAELGAGSELERSGRVDALACGDALEWTCVGRAGQAGPAFVEGPRASFRKIPTGNEDPPGTNKDDRGDGTREGGVDLASLGAIVAACAAPGAPGRCFVAGTGSLLAARGAGEMNLSARSASSSSWRWRGGGVVAEVDVGGARGAAATRAVPLCDGAGDGAGGAPSALVVVRAMPFANEAVSAARRSAKKRGWLAGLFSGA